MKECIFLELRDVASASKKTFCIGNYHMPQQVHMKVFDG